MDEVGKEQLKGDLASPSPLPSHFETPSIVLAGIPYDHTDRFASTKKWLEENPQNHMPYRKIITEDGKEIWVDKDGKLVKRDVLRERDQIRHFLEKLKTSDPDHYGLLQELKTKIPPMNSKTRVAVNIPAWMEGKFIYHTLDLYSNQVDNEGKDLDPDLYEINIIVNRKKGDFSDDSVSEIERFKRDSVKKGKNFHINYVDVEFPEPFNSVGNARRVITDLTLLRSLERENQEAPLYIEPEDADLTNVDPKTLINSITKLDKNPHLDALVGMQDRTPEIMMEHDLLFLYRRFQDMYVTLLSNKRYRPEENLKFSFNWNRVVTGGWNNAYTAEAYALTGGYDPYKTKDEDMIIGEKISMLRGNGLIPNTQVIGKVNTRSDSSPRRYIYEIATVKPAYGESFEDPNVNEIIRNTSLEKLMELILPFARINNDNMWRFQAMINEEYGFIKTTTPNLTEAKKLTRRALLMLGFKNTDYEFKESGDIVVNTWENVKKALDDYRSRHKK